MNKTRQDHIKMIALIMLLDAATSQIYIDYLVNGFRISVSVILLPVIYFYNRKINPILTSFFIGGFGLIFRGLVGIGLYGDFKTAVLMDWPILVFDITYGILYYVLFYHMKEKSMIRWFFVVWICDFISNLFEMTVRVGSVASDSTAIINTLITVGFFRTIIACIVVFAFKYYQVIFQREAKYEKYRSFYSVFADLKSETYFMRENMDHIEEVMSEAYLLYEHFSETEDETAKEISLRIAKDVHEIKKNYNKVIDGINKIGKLDDSYDYLDIRELIQLLNDYYESEKNDLPIVIEMTDKLKQNYKIKKHFLLMSIMRNLISNSIEAMPVTQTRQIIELEVYDDDINLVIKVRDNGQGIKDKDLDLIFQPGYSTKFNEETGDIYRGLGLTLVRDIVSNQFNGQIEVFSKFGIGTTFTVKLNRQYLGE